MKENGKKESLIVIIISIICILAIMVQMMCCIFFEVKPIIVRQKEIMQGKTDEKRLRNWLDNSGWESQIDILETSFTPTKTTSFFFGSPYSTTGGSLLLTVKYKGEIYKISLSVGNSEKENNANIFFTIHEKEIEIYVKQAIIEKLENYDIKVSYVETDFTPEDYEVKIKKITYNKVDNNIDSSTTLENFFNKMELNISFIINSKNFNNEQEFIEIIKKIENTLNELGLIYGKHSYEGNNPSKNINEEFKRELYKPIKKNL